MGTAARLGGRLRWSLASAGRWRLGSAARSRCRACRCRRRSGPGVAGQRRAGTSASAAIWGYPTSPSTSSASLTRLGSRGLRVGGHMENDAVTLVRQVAARLAASDPSVVPLVEAELARTAGQPPEQFPVEWIDLAKLLVPSVFAAYPIIKDWHRGRRDVLRRRLKLALDEKGVPATGQRDAIIEALLDELRDQVE